MFKKKQKEITTVERDKTIGETGLVVSMLIHNGFHTIKVSTSKKGQVMVKVPKIRTEYDSKIVDLLFDELYKMGINYDTLSYKGSQYLKIITENITVNNNEN